MFDILSTRKNACAFEITLLFKSGKKCDNAGIIPITPFSKRTA
jgi:hypothetical protein